MCGARPVPRWRRQSQTSQHTAAMLNAETMYPPVWFEFSHPVNTNAEIRAAAAAPPTSNTRSRGSDGEGPRNARLTTRKNNPAAAALKTAVIRLARQAYSPNGMTPAHTCASSRNKGVPGGGGGPRILEVAMNSPASPEG